jgi:acyl-CoA thioesterase I
MTTRSTTQGTDMNQAMLEKLIRFQRPERNLPYLPGLGEDRAAALFDIAPEWYREALAGFAAEAREAAEALLERPGLADAVDRLPFLPGQRVVALGESSTADRLSWFEILRHLVAITRPGHDIDFVNLAVSGRTTTKAKAQAAQLRRQEPAWVLCGLGANDALRFAGLGHSRQVSRPETEANLAELRLGADPSATWIWLTPNTIDPDRADMFAPFRAAGFSWEQKDLDEIARFLVTRPEPVIDTRAATTPREGTDLHLNDGVHLTVEGQQAVAATVVAALAA